MKSKKYVNWNLALLTPILAFLPFWLACTKPSGSVSTQSPGEVIALPKPTKTGSISVEHAIHQRRSTRSFKNDPLSVTQISQILFAAQGITCTRRGFRTVPSAGATYPLELYIIIGKADGIDPGLYRYLPQTHSLELIKAGDQRQYIISKVCRQGFVSSAPVVLIVSAVYERITSRYSERGKIYTHMEVGHVGQNVHLQCEALGLGTVMIGAFNETELAKLMSLPNKEIPLYIMPLGKK